MLPPLLVPTLRSILQNQGKVLPPYGAPEMALQFNPHQNLNRFLLTKQPT